MVSDSNSSAENICRAKWELSVLTEPGFIFGKDDAVKGNTETFLCVRIMKASVSSSVCHNFHDKPFILGRVFYQTVKPQVRLLT